MIVKIFKKNSKSKNSMVDPDEIFLDSKNLQNFDRQQFEGRLEKPISKETITFLGIFAIIIIAVFGARLTQLQIVNGSTHKERGENNTLERVLILSDRGIIYDRNQTELAWNRKPEFQAVDTATNAVTEPTEDELPVRAYRSPGFSHVLGHVSYPSRDSSGNYWQSEFIGRDGIEKEYNDVISGVNGSKIIEINALGRVHSENIINVPERGQDMTTTLDSRIQSRMFTLIRNLSEGSNFTGGAGIIMDARNGEIVASTSFPEYNSEILSLGKDREKINGYITDKRKFFLDRVVSGLYTPGSIVKPFLALGALSENLISPSKEILSTGSISIPNPYFPDQNSIFRDWRAHGWTDMAEALAVSSDVYFYTIGGGFEGQKGLGIANIEKYVRLFGIGGLTGTDIPDEKSGTVPNPEWKKKNFSGDPWRVGDTYNTAIGQYGFQVTPIEMVRATGAIANRGYLVTPHFVLGDVEKEEATYIEIKNEHFDVVHDGMRQAVTYGTAVALNVPYVKVAAKTGTAQLGLSKNKVNSWVTGFFPYEDPKYAFTILMESGLSAGTVGATSVMRGLLDWMSTHTPEYFE